MEPTEPRGHDGPQEEPLCGQVVVASESLRCVYELAARAAEVPAPVLILGETGTGKDVLARYIHTRSGRRPDGLRSLNCGALPRDLLEATLFGHMRGAFTGAVKDAAGTFEQAHGGTVFLDEVGELKEGAQAALLRVIESGQLTRIGATREIKVDARVVAATNRDLETMVNAGRFRRDLLYRLNTVTLTIPPLRDRPADVVPLAHMFLERACERWKRDVGSMATDCEQALLAHPWPGNVRELRNVIERALLVVDGDVLRARHLPPHVQECHVGAPGTPVLPTRAPSAPGLRQAVRDYEAALIARALQRVGGSRRRAAALLKVPKRTLDRKIQLLGLAATTAAHEHVG